MATWAGSHIGTSQGWDFPGRSAHLDGFAGPLWQPDAAVSAAGLLGGPRTSAQPVTERAAALTGAPVRSFSDDFYHRIWMLPSAIDAGNVVDNLAVLVDVWNAYLVRRTLRAITRTGEALILEQPVSLPHVWHGTELRTYTVRIPAVGPVVLSAAWLWDWTTETRTLTAAGRRIVPWLWRPNWRDGVRERLEWLTDVRGAWDGTEQRAGLRARPRYTLEGTVSARGPARRELAAALAAWGGRA
jgi:hypothetical protein